MGRCTSPGVLQELAAEVEAFNPKALAKVEAVRLLPGYAGDQLDFTAA
jgi:hypothetical protein